MEAQNNHSITNQEETQVTPQTQPTTPKHWRPDMVTWAIVGCAVVVIALGVWIARSITGWVEDNNQLSLTSSDKIELTPTQVQSIRNIGEWEFLAVSDEEIVDTARRGIFSKDELVRIYYGTVRLGIDLKQLQDDWAVTNKDTLVVTLPGIVLLDERFIDEGRTRSFYEDGNWNQEARKALYQKAYRLLYNRCVTRENVTIAENNAYRQFTDLFHSMGFNQVKVIIKPSELLPGTKR